MEYFKSVGNVADALLVVISVLDCFVLQWVRPGGCVLATQTMTLAKLAGELPAPHAPASQLVDALF